MSPEGIVKTEESRGKHTYACHDQKKKICTTAGLEPAHRGQPHGTDAEGFPWLAVKTTRQLPSEAFDANGMQEGSLGGAGRKTSARLALVVWVSANDAKGKYHAISLWRAANLTNIDCTCEVPSAACQSLWRCLLTQTCVQRPARVASSVRSAHPREVGQPSDTEETPSCRLMAGDLLIAKQPPCHAAR